MNSIYVANAFKQTQLAWINMQLRSYTCKRKPFVLKGTSSCPASATREEHQFSQTMDGHTWHVRSTFVEVVSDASSTSGTECRRSRSEPPSEVGRPLDQEIMVDMHGLGNPSRWVQPVPRRTPTPMNSQVNRFLLISPTPLALVPLDGLTGRCQSRHLVARNSAADCWDQETSACGIAARTRDGTGA